MVDKIKQTGRAPGVRDDHAGVAMGTLSLQGDVEGKRRRVSLISFLFRPAPVALLYSIGYE
jgi:hypothetical protein